MGLSISENNAKSIITITILPALLLRYQNGLLLLLLLSVLASRKKHFISTVCYILISCMDSLYI